MKNAFDKAGQMFINHLYAFHQVLTPPGERVLSPEEFLREWSIDEIAQMDFDILIAGHGPVLTKAAFLKQRDRVAAIRERVRALNRQHASQADILQALLKEFNYGTGPAAGQIEPMMTELK